jgi:hypothetical protein
MHMDLELRQAHAVERTLKHDSQSFDHFVSVCELGIASLAFTLPGRANTTISGVEPGHFRLGIAFIVQKF